jgi:hypothetical protein
LIGKDRYKDEDVLGWVGAQSNRRLAKMHEAQPSTRIFKIIPNSKPKDRNGPEKA